MVENHVFKKSDASQKDIELRKFYLGKYADTDVELSIQNLDTESETGTAEYTTGDARDRCPESHIYESEPVTREQTPYYKIAPISGLKCLECNKVLET